MNKSWRFWLFFSLSLLIFLFLIRSILLPFVLGILVAYMLDPLADRFQKMRLSRSAATSLVTVLFFIVFGTIGVVVIPLVFHQLSGLILSIPEYMAQFDSQYRPRVEQLLGALPAEHMDTIKTTLTNFSGALIGLLTNFITGLLSSGGALINLLSLILITPLVAFYMLRDWDRLVAHIDTLLPRKHYDTIRAQLIAIDNTLAGFLRGQINVCLILGVFYSVGLSVVGLKFGVVIGLVTGLLVILPYVGLMAGMATGLAVAFFQFDSYGQIGAVLAVFLMGQILEGYYFTPKLVGEKVGLHPVWIIFGLLAGGALFGFVGVLIAVPVSAVIGVLIRFGLSRYLKSSYYQ